MPDSLEPSDKSRTVALILATILGPFGGHRFYTGHKGSGALMALTIGGMGIWYLYDVIVVASGGFRDAEGRLVYNWEVEPVIRPQVTDDVLHELEDLRREVAELTERVDFTERLLANSRREALPDPGRRAGGAAPG